MSAPATETISHYKLLDLLGRGAMGEVWLAEDLQLPRRVAIKLLPRHLSEDRESVERLMREARAAASVDHPAVVAVYEAGMADSRPYLVMQRVEGETLEQRLARGPLAPEEVGDLGLKIADALAEVHALGIIHRDLKAANIVLTARGPKILDFGLASVRGTPGLTASGAALGTPIAMSPEQIKGLPPDNRSDLWSLGVMLYHALTGELPFRGDSLEAVGYQVLHRDPPPPSRVRPEVGPDLDYAVLKLLRKDPRHRYARAEDLIADLESCSWCRAPGVPSSETGAMASPRVAVLHFEVLSSDADDAFLAAGLTEDLIVDLSRVQGVRVATRAEVVPYRDRPVPPRTVARELGVDYVVMGSVRRAGNRARITAQVVRGDDGQSIWTERFDRTLDDLFDVQAEVSMRIVEALQVALQPGEREMLERAPTRSAEAYALYLRGRAALDLETLDANRRAEGLLEAAIELDPNFALAHAALGECYAVRPQRWWTDLVEADRAIPCVDRALALEPDLLEAHLVRAMIHRVRGDAEQVLAAVARVLAVNPNHAQGIEFASWSQLSMGRPAEALEALERLHRLRPDRYVTLMHLGHCYAMLHRDEDVKLASQALREAALEELRRHPENLHARTMLAGALIRLGERDAGLREAERAALMAPHDRRVRYNVACTYALAGLGERAIEELEQGIKDLPSYLVDWPRHDPDLASIHHHPEFIRMFGKA